ncbi:hypothetical protein IFR05_005743 [Cadophora sp. M221]|nr:hypothetical protein IFR05_005743 [Cadophora sp. M221]
MPITDEEDIEDLSARFLRLKLWTPGPLKQFHPFPRLPTELRRLIFKFALPSSKRMITVTAHYRDLMPEKTPHVFFTATPQDPCLPLQLEDVKDVQLLSVCFESREVFLESNGACIPGSSKSLIRFNQQHSTIFISNYHDLIANESLGTAYKSGLWQPKWPGTIHNLALGDRLHPIWKLWRRKNTVEKCFYYMSAFTSLRQLWLAESVPQELSPFLDPKTPQCCSLWREIIHKYQLSLDEWVPRFCSGYMVPRVKLMAYGPGFVGFGLHP